MGVRHYPRVTCGRLQSGRWQLVGCALFTLIAPAGCSHWTWRPRPKMRKRITTCSGADSDQEPERPTLDIFDTLGCSSSDPNMSQLEANNSRVELFRDMNHMQH